VSWPLWVIPIVSLVFVPIEEYVFRGVVLRWTWRVVGFVPALLVSSFAFGVAHGLGPWLWVRCIQGLILGVLYYRTRSLWPCIVAHYVCNAALVTVAFLVGF
jgi:membrane protease YdiL (CAAX protease family)